MSDSCSLCDRIRSSPDSMTLWKTSHALLYHMSGIDLPGYLVVAPTRHVEHAGELHDSELGDLARLQSHATREILKIPGVRKIYTLSFGEVLPHLHIHLFPRTDFMIEDREVFTDGLPDGTRIFQRWRERLAVSSPSKSVEELIIRMKTASGTSSELSDSGQEPSTKGDSHQPSPGRMGEECPGKEKKPPAK